jgi:hypothetical protein
MQSNETDRDVRPMMTELESAEIHAVEGGSGCAYAIIMALLSPGDPAAAAGVSWCFV